MTPAGGRDTLRSKTEGEKEERRWASFRIKLKGALHRSPSGEEAVREARGNEEQGWRIPATKEAPSAATVVRPSPVAAQYRAQIVAT